MKFSGVGALVNKELLSLLRDPKSAFMIFFPIVLFLTLFVFASTKDVENSSIVVFNQDSGAHSVNLLDKIVNTKIFSKAVYVNNNVALDNAINVEDAFIGMVFPENFSKNIDKKKRADVQILVDGRRTNSATIVYGYLSQILARYQQRLLGSVASSTLPSVTTRTWYNPNKEQKWFAVTNLICIIIVSQAISLTALSIAREKEQGTFDQLLVSPINPLGMLIGKTIPSIVISLFMGACVMFLGHMLYGVPINGSLLLMLFSMTIYVISVVGIGVCIAAFANTQQQAMLGTFLLQMPMTSLSGLLSPVESIENPIMKLFVICNPVAYGNKLVKGIMLKNMGILDTIENVMPIVFIGFFVTGIAAFTFAKKHRIKMF
ncbi:MAG: ABC transporter permease [Holosporales bacterium]|nr:ABC transporter permease [Holosporales bacterium]